MRTDCLDEGTLRAYLDRELTAGRQGEVREHLSRCTACSQALAELEGTARMVSTALAAASLPSAQTGAAWQRLAARLPQATGNELRITDHGRLSGFRILAWRLQLMSDYLRLRWRPALVGVALAAVLVSLFTVAPLRAAAGQFLDIFRVRKLAVVQVNTGQIQRLESFREQIFSEPKMQKAEAVKVGSAAEAAKVAGFNVLTPGRLPSGMAQDGQFVVEPGGHAETQVDLKAARGLLQMANLSTDAIPAGRDTLDVSAEIKPAVAMRFTQGSRELNIIQAVSPEVNVPPDVNLARLGEVGLELLGMSPDAAQRFSRSIDWATTLVLPIPTNMASAQEVPVRGTTGYLVTEAARQGKTGQVALIWQQNGLLYMVGGDVDGRTVRDVADGLK